MAHQWKASPTNNADDRVYRLNRFDVEVRGRWREFSRSIFTLLLLFVMQQPLWLDALGKLGDTPHIAPVTSLRMSLILDVGFVISYVIVSYRAWGLVRAFRAPTPIAIISRSIAYYLIPALVALDALEDYYLWTNYTKGETVTSLSWVPSQEILLWFWGPSQEILFPSQEILFWGLSIGLAVTVLLAAITDPRLYWKREGIGIKRRQLWPSVRRITRAVRSSITRWKRLQRITRAVRSRITRWERLQRITRAVRSRITRWKGVLQSDSDDGSCNCHEATMSPHTATPKQDMASTGDWGIICCSGGGVRSAAFSLGGLQALNAQGIYEKADAVVGVSGGGYTSTAFHVTRWQSGDTMDKLVDHKMIWTLDPREVFTPSSPELQWLRRHTHYVLDSARVAVQAALTLAYGIAVNLVLLAVAIGATAWFLAWVYLASGTITLPTQKAKEFVTTASLKAEGAIGLDLGGDWRVLQYIWLVPLVGIALFLIEQAVDRFATIPHHIQMRLREWSTRLVAFGALLCLLLLGLPALVTALFDYADTSGSPYARLIYSLGIVPQDHCEAVLATPGPTPACGVEDTPGAGASGVAAVSIITIVTSILAVLASIKGASKSSTDGSGVGGLLNKVWAKIKDPIVPWVAVALIVLVCLVQLVRWTAALTTQPDRLNDWWYPLWAGVTLLLLKVFSEPNRTSLHHFFRERIAYAFFVRRRHREIESMPYNRPLRFSRSAPREDRMKGPRLVTCAVANASDPTLVPSQRGCTPFVFDDEEIGLTDRLLPVGAARRKSGTYEFAADHGYRDATIPAAVAMSAAAFSPLAGRENVRLGPYRAVLALGNARLGVWLPNPLWLDPRSIAQRQARFRESSDFEKTWNGLSCQDAHEVWHKLGSAQRWAHDALDASPGEPRHAAIWARPGHPPKGQPANVPETFGDRWRRRAWRFGEATRTIFKKPGMTRIGREAVGQASIYDRFLYVTDGGHYDNLGLIEALRRKPRRIFVIDASNDPEDTFRALGLAVATARMDLNCELVVDPRPMRKLQEKRSAAAWCVGSARFEGETEATCAVYLVKAIMLDDLTWDVETYAASNLSFPRTSTSRQLYSEFDFEAYRMLGLHAVNQLLDSESYRQLERQLADPAQEVLDELLNALPEFELGIELVDAWTEGPDVLCLVYRQPEHFQGTLGLWRRVEGVGNTERLVSQILIEELGEPMGSYEEWLHRDEHGVMWWAPGPP